MPPLVARCFLVMAMLSAPAARALTATSVFPAREATQVCVDTPLRLSFDGAPRLGTSGV